MFEAHERWSFLTFAGVTREERRAAATHDWFRRRDVGEYHIGQLRDAPFCRETMRPFAMTSVAAFNQAARPRSPSASIPFPALVDGLLRAGRTVPPRSIRAAVHGALPAICRRSDKHIGVFDDAAWN